MQMRPSRVMKKLRAGQVASCVKIDAADTRVVEIACRCGFDCIWVDMEHVPADWSTIKTQILAAKVYDVDTVVRVARGSYSDLIRPLEADATGIMVPHIMNLQEARQIVRQTRFHPLGLRPLDGGGCDGAFCMLPVTEYIESANRERFVIVQIEDKEPLDDLEEIAALPGIDIIFFGPGDFSQSIGAPGQGNHPKIAEARKRIAEVANKHGKIAGTVSSLDGINELVDMGYRFINCGADVIGLGQYFSSITAAFGKVQKGPSGTYA